MEQIVHIPIMLKEVSSFLCTKTGKRFVDGTVGQGGHSEYILSCSPPVSRLLGLDRDASSLSVAKKRLARFKDRVILINGSYADLKEIAYAHDFTPVDGILLDLGFSSYHVDEAERGFSFDREGPLDMRYDRKQELTAAEIVNEWGVDELAEIFRKYGEERFAREIAGAIVRARRKQEFKTTKDLADLVTETIGARGKVHPATRVFQALRIVVNDELGHLESSLTNLVDLLAPGGRLVIISFHSLEDRIIKQFFKKEERLKILTKKVIKPTREEILENPRSRSAKLRAAERI